MNWQTLLQSINDKHAKYSLATASGLRPNVNIFFVFYDN